MSDVTAADQIERKKPSKLPIILGLIAGLLGAGGGFYTTYFGQIFAKESPTDVERKITQLENLADIGFVEVAPIIVTLRPGSSNKHLSFRSQLEVPKQYREDVEHLLPRIVDVMNGYLRALETEDFESPAIIVRLRSQLLRRIQVVTGIERVNNLLVMEFVLN
ncbi:MAG: flagellar FliL protein [Candidatus Azotimanducaceae bacterium]|jgi:flagellar FliL protein